MIETKSGHNTEDVLVQHYRRGNRDALAALIRNFHPKLLRMIAYQLGDSRPVEDIAQDCWYAIIKQLPDLELRIGFSAWAASIARRKAIDWIRAQQRARSRSGETDLNDVPDIESTGTENTADRIESIRIGIRQLPPTGRIILELFYLEHMSLRKISEALNIPEGTVKSRLFYAREKLKEIINK